MRNYHKLPLIALLLLNFVTLASCDSESEIEEIIVSKDTEVNNYIKKMNIDKDKVLSQDFGDKITLKDGKSFENSTAEEGLNLIVTHKEVKNVKNATGDIKAMDANTNAIYPGGIVKCDEHLLSDSPTPDGLNRGQIRLNVKLNGADEKIGTIVCKAEPGKVTAGINESLEAWFKKGYNIGANAQTEVTQAYNSQSLDASFGIRGLANKFGISIGAKEEVSKNTYIVSYEQIYFSVVNDYTYNESSLYSDDVSLTQIKEEYPENDKGYCDNPPVLVDSVQYGRMIFLKLETNMNITEVNAAFQFLNQEVKEKDPEKKKKIEAEIKLKFNQTMANSNMSYLVYGGPSSSTVLTPIGDDPGKTILEKVKEGSEFQSFKTGSYKLLGYSTKFLKDNTKATFNRTSQYVETTRRTLQQQHIYIENNGWFTIRAYYLEAKKITGFDEKGNPTFESTPSFVLSRTAVMKHKGFHHLIPANYGQAVFRYDVRSGADWPYQGRVTTANFFADAKIYTKGTCLHPYTEFTVDGVFRTV